MCARPRKVSDDDLLAATLRAMSRLGPGELTLGAIAAEAGVTAAVLVQRFGSKRDLLLTLAARGAEGAGDFLDGLVREHASPLAALNAYVDCVSGLAASPAALVRNLAYLQTDLEDADFRKHLVRHARVTRGGLQRLLDAARTSGELRRDADPERLARLVEAIVGGGMLTWAHYRKGTAAAWVRALVDDLLAPWLATGKPAR